MKQTIVLLSFLLLSNYSSNAQMILESTFPNSSVSNTWANSMPAEVVNLLLSGKKIAVQDMANSKVYLYNLDYSLFLTINLPVLAHSVPNNAYYISENCFKIDGYVDMAVCYTDTLTDIWTQAIIDQTGTIINSIDSCGGINIYNTGPDSFKAIALRIFSYSNHQNHYKPQVYSLPGTMPCNTCNTNGTLGLAKNGKLNSNIPTQPLPNPSTNEVKITFKLPAGVNEANLVLYNTTGQKLRSYTVDNRFGYILLDNSQLATGVYYYNIEANGVVSSTQKMVVIK